MSETKPRIVHYADYGSDTNGDGSATRPFQSREAAEVFSQPGDELCENGVHSTMPTRPPVARNLLLLIGLWAGCWAMAIAAGWALLTHPQTASRSARIIIAVIVLASDEQPEPADEDDVRWSIW